MVAAAAAPMSVFNRPAIANRVWSLDQISYAMLAGQVRTTFLVCVSRWQEVRLKLLQAPVFRPAPHQPGSPRPPDAGNEKFSLIFCGLKIQPLEPAIHRIIHEKLGEFAMFIGQIGQPEGGHIYYESVFNRLPPRIAVAAIPA